MPVVRGLELSAFAAEHDRLTVEYLATQERLGCMRPAWRFAWVDDGGAVGARVSYWGLAGEDRPLLVDVILDAGAVGTVEQVLATSLAELDIEIIDYLATRPPSGERSPRTEPRALEAAGFALIATQLRLGYSRPEVAVPAPPVGIAVRPAGELGRDALLELIAAAQVDSGDRATRDRVAAEELELFEKLDHDPRWWELAVVAWTDEPLGFVIPARTDDGGAVIAFIGVTPGARGRGLGRMLLARGTAALRGEPSVDRVIADVDEDNAPMLRVAAAVGYERFASRANYRYVRARPR